MMLPSTCIYLLCCCCLLSPLTLVASFNLTMPRHHSNPEAVVEDVHRRVNVSISRRQMLTQQSSCLTGNPIDDCWRCDPNWSSNRQRLADCCVGFGSAALGGKGGEIYTVTDSSDHDAANPTPGTLRYGVIQEVPLWIVFSGNMLIKLKHELMVNSYKTIDGRGANVQITGGGCITMQYVSNVIIHNVQISQCVPTGNTNIRASPTHIGYRGKSDGDGISIFGSRDIWIDHVSLSYCADGLIDAIMGSTGLTISNNYFAHHNDVMLLGHDDKYLPDSGMQVTIAFNHFGEGLVQRMPRCRRGYIHVVNNDFTGWKMYAIGGSADPTVNSQGNRYIGPTTADAKEVTKRVDTGEGEWAGWNWRSEGDVMENGAFFVPSGVGLSTEYSKASSVDPKSALRLANTPGHQWVYPHFTKTIYTFPNLPFQNTRNYMDAHICQCLTRLNTIRRNLPVTFTGDRSLTGKLFVDQVTGLAGELVDIGIRNGHVVAICALNSDRYLVWLLAITFLGGIAAPLNYRWSLEEAKYAIELVRPVMLVTDECAGCWYSEFKKEMIPFLKWHVLMNYSSKDQNTKRFNLTSEALNKPDSKFRSLSYSQAPNGAAIICFTSGTTGKPKGVAISHSALIMQSLAKVAIVGYCEDDVYLHTAPLCHIGGISSAMAMLMVGACHVIISKFDAKSAVKAIKQFHVTSFITVPTMMADILSFIRMETWKGEETVRKILNGGGSLSDELIKDATVFFPKAIIISAYGMTETCSSMTFSTLYDPQRENPRHFTSHVPGAVCVGKPAPHIEIKIRLDGFDRVGRILTRGPHVMLGYWGHMSTKATNSANDGGWLDTGDIGQMDEYGNVWLIGRSKGRIKSGGENVYPEEVEAILSQHPGVHAVVVVGVPNARLSEMVVACVRLRANWKWIESNFDHSSQSKSKTLSNRMLQQFCRDRHLTGFKIPKLVIMWRKQFPMTTTGKLKRDEVRTEVIDCMNFLPSSL